ncbi:four-carbon acid sugar kinase family protein [Streptomyces sp. CA-132043]|uniref:four-carbon acid sugar kinase family protein n=1 Tax=Streptomyces sp. CA-132043 TaxID=3240048 RepID=UPI003D8FC559
MSPSKGVPLVVALADDLSGAAEVAALLRLPALLALRPAQPPRDGEAVVVDLDSRHLPSAAAAEAVRAALAGHPGETTWYKKSDSLLRGNVGAEAVAFAEGARAVVTAMALPALGRVVRDGVVHVEGVPLHDSGAWRAEERAAPRSVAEALAPLPTAGVPLDAVRQGPRALAGRLAAVAARGRHPVCDAETDVDLDVIAEAVRQLGSAYRLLGSGGLAAALGRHVGTGTPAQDVPAAYGPLPTADGPLSAADRPLLVVAGSAEPGVVAQIARLTAAGARHLPLAPDAVAGPAPVPLPPLAPGSVTVLSIDGTGSIRPGAARRLVAGLARTVAALTGTPDLVLTGGETARRVLDAVRITALRPVGEIHHGAVHCRTADGRSVVTRPGSFGGPDSLHRIAAALRPRLLPPPPAARPALPAPAGPAGPRASSQGVTQ